MDVAPAEDEMKNAPDNAAPSPLQLPVRYYQIGRLYGPDMPASGTDGLHDRVLQKPIGQVGLVAVHCWNLGEPDGPYPIDSDARYPGEAADWVPEAHAIVRDRIGPVLDACRGGGTGSGLVICI